MAVMQAVLSQSAQVDSGSIQLFPAPQSPGHGRCTISAGFLSPFLLPANKIGKWQYDKYL